MLFNEIKAKKAMRILRVDSLNPTKGIFSSLSVSKNKKNYVTVLCLTNRTISTKFPNEDMALAEMARYKQLYKEIPSEKAV